MKQVIKMMCVSILLSGLVFSANSRVLKSEFKKDRMKRIEPDYRRGSATRDACAHQYPNNPNSELTVIDSSANGYGMVSTVTRPMDVNSYGDMLVVYRQYAGENTTHGQLGAGYGVVTDGAVQWDVQYNVNSNGNPPWGGGGVGGGATSQARYPSAIASEEYPYAVWNEYTGNVADWPSSCSSYGGRPYFSYDEFGWGGESWLYPAELDPLYDCTKDLWTGSVGYGYDETTGEHHVTAVYDDWTRTGSYQFTSEAVADGYIVLGSEALAVNPQHLGTDGYSSAAILSMNDNGQGLLGVDGIFAGNDMDAGTCTAPASNITCNKTPMFRLTDDYGLSWYGDRDAFDFYYVPDNVFDDIFSQMPATDIDACTGEVSDITDFWSWYEFDMRVDQEGNPHAVVSIIAESANYFHFLDGYTGFYHLTIDRDNLDEPGPVNSATGWNWSYIPLPANDSFNWSRPDGYSYLYGSMCQISLSRDNPDIVYMVANIAAQGEMSSDFDANGDGIEDDPCGTQESPWDLYPNWSEDIWVAKSSDNGSTWTALDNLTQTPRDPNNTGTNNCAPEEQYAHTAHWSDDERVYYQYNQPNWEFNEIGDPLGADCMNRVFLGYSWVAETGVGGCTNMNNCSYDPDAAFDNGSCATGLYACSDGTSGCGCDGACGDGLTPPAVIDCDGVCGGGAVELCLSGGGVDCFPVGTETCTEGSYNDGLCDDLNSWYDCNSVFCGTDDPLFHPGDDSNEVSECGEAGFISCDGGRCYTCSNGGSDYQECVDAGLVWSVITNASGLDLVTDEASCTGEWIEFADPSFGGEAETDEVEEGDMDECYCTAEGAEDYCEAKGCLTGDLNGDTVWNVLDIVGLANCVLAGSCGDAADGGCAGDLNEDGVWNVLDIVSLANCVLAGTCGGRVNDASHSELIIEDNLVSIEADGFIGGVEMTLTHGDDFEIEMTENAMFADYLTTDNQTRLLVITPETDELFSFNGDFVISEIIVANTQYEVSVDLPVVSSFSLSEAYPNPFNPTTAMTLTMPMAGDMQVEVYNLLGQVVSTLASGYMDAGTYNLTWDASDVSSGMYFVKAQTQGFTTTQKLMLVK